MSALELTTAPQALPATISDVKRHLGVTDEEHDSDIELAIKAAANYLTRRTGRSLITTRYTLKLKQFPKDRYTPVELPYPPLKTIVSVNYYDGDNVSQAYSTYQLQTTTDAHASIFPEVGEDWPCTKARIDAVTIVYDAGVDTDEEIPPEANQFIRLWCRQQYDNADGHLTREVKSGLESLAHSLWIGKYADPDKSPY